MFEWLFRRGFKEYLFKERLPVITTPALGRGFFILHPQHARSYLLRHNEISQPEVLGRVERQRAAQGQRYTVSVTPYALLSDREKQMLEASIAPYKKIEARGLSIEEAREDLEKISRVFIFIDFQQSPIQQFLPENVVTGVFTSP